MNLPPPPPNDTHLPTQQHHRLQQTLTSTVSVRLTLKTHVARAVVASFGVTTSGVVWTGTGIALIDVVVTHGSIPAWLAEADAGNFVTALTERSVAGAIFSAV